MDPHAHRSPAPRRSLAALWLLLASGCGGDGAPAQPGGTGTARTACEDLAAVVVPPAAIGMPTSGAAVVSAVAVPAGGLGAEAVAAHCLVTARVRPIDPLAPDLHLQIALPGAWNGKAVMLGGAGLNGAIPAVTGNILNAAPVGATPLARGYAVFASDGGHQSANPGADGAAFTNDEVLGNWLGDALKKTRDVSQRLIRDHYGRAPERSYFLGSSTGGREALTAIARWPDDWDGAVALYPARAVVPLAIGVLDMARSLAAPGAYPSPAQRALLHRAAMEACDKLDGAADGVVSHVRACRQVFDPATAVAGGRPLRCPGGQEGGDTCLSDAQLQALARIQGAVPLPFAPPGGAPAFPGFNVLFADNGSRTDSASGLFAASLGLGSAAPSFPIDVRRGAATSAVLADQFFRHAVLRDATANVLLLDGPALSTHADRLTTLSALDVTAAPSQIDLAAFARRGGKLLLAHGTEDMLIPPRATEDYYLALRARMGSEAVDRFVRYYEVPGFGHAFSTVFNAAWDQLTALEAWAERGVDPASREVVVDTLGVPGRTRPLCPYPTWPKYQGAGSADDARSFSCARN